MMEVCIAIMSSSNTIAGMYCIRVGDMVSLLITSLITLILDLVRKRKDTTGEPKYIIIINHVDTPSVRPDVPQATQICVSPRDNVSSAYVSKLREADNIRQGDLIGGETDHQPRQHIR